MTVLELMNFFEQRGVNTFYLEDSHGNETLYPYIRDKDVLNSEATFIYPITNRTVKISYIQKGEY